MKRIIVTLAVLLFGNSQYYYDEHVLLDVKVFTNVDLQDSLNVFVRRQDVSKMPVLTISARMESEDTLIEFIAAEMSPTPIKISDYGLCLGSGVGARTIYGKVMMVNYLGELSLLRYFNQDFISSLDYCLYKKCYEETECNRSAIKERRYRINNGKVYLVL